MWKRAPYFWQSWLKRILGLSGPFPGSFMLWRKRNMAEVRGSGLGSVTVSGLWNMKRPNKNETSRFQEILTMQQIRHQGDHFKSKAVCLERTKGIKKKKRWAPNCTRLVSTGGQILSLYPFSFTSWMRSMSMCVWDRFCEDNRIILRLLDWPF